MFLVFGSAILIILGVVHAVLVLATNVFEPKDHDLLSVMKGSSPQITKSTNLWRAGVGFHLSHSLGLVVTGFLAWYIGSGLLKDSESLTIFHVFVVCVTFTYLLLSIRYWFILPTIGFAISTLCFLGWCIRL